MLVALPKAQLIPAAVVLGWLSPLPEHGVLAHGLHALEPHANIQWFHAAFGLFGLVQVRKGQAAWLCAHDTGQIGAQITTLAVEDHGIKTLALQCVAKGQR